MGMPPLTELLRDERNATSSLEGIHFTNNPAARLWDVMVHFRNGLPPMKTRIKASTREQAEAFTLARYPYADQDRIEVASEGELPIKPLPERKATAPWTPPARQNPTPLQKAVTAARVEALKTPKPAPRLEPYRKPEPPADPSPAAAPERFYTKNGEELEHRFIAAMWRQDGGKIDSWKLMESLGWDRVTFMKTRSALAAAGRIVVQRGPGACISLPTVAEAMEAAAETAQAVEAPEKPVAAPVTGIPVTPQPSRPEPQPVSPAFKLPPAPKVQAAEPATDQLTPGEQFRAGGVVITDANAKLAAEMHHRGDARWVDLAARIGCNADHLRKRARAFYPSGPPASGSRNRWPVAEAVEATEAEKAAVLEVVKLPFWLARTDWFPPQDEALAELGQLMRQHHYELARCHGIHPTKSPVTTLRLLLQLKGRDLISSHLAKQKIRWFYKVSGPAGQSEPEPLVVLKTSAEASAGLMPVPITELQAADLVQPFAAFHPQQGWSMVWSGAFPVGPWLKTCGYTHFLRLSDLPCPSA